MNMQLIDQVQRLAELHQSGKLTDEEFKIAKTSLISGALDGAGIEGLERLAKLSGEGLGEDEFKQLKESIIAKTEKTDQQLKFSQPKGPSTSTTGASTSGSSRNWMTALGVVAAVLLLGIVVYAVKRDSEPNCASSATTKLVAKIAKDNQRQVGLIDAVYSDNYKRMQRTIAATFREFEELESLENRKRAIGEKLKGAMAECRRRWAWTQECLTSSDVEPSSLANYVGSYVRDGKFVCLT